MIRIASGVIDQFIYFNPGDLGLSSFTVTRSRNGAAAATMTTPTINETSSSLLPGVYELLLDEDMVIGAGNLTEHMIFIITHAGILPQFVEIELFDPNNYVVGTVTENTDMRGTDIADILSSQLTESYAADGVAPTLTQALFLIQQILGDFAIVGTTLTVKKIDGSTTAATFTLDDATSPTSITRAT